MVLLVTSGEWVPAWLFMSITFLVASLGVVGLGWWVLRGDARRPKSNWRRRSHRRAATDRPPLT
jgi:hypothetical protein